MSNLFFLKNFTDWNIPRQIKKFFKKYFFQGGKGRRLSNYDNDKIKRWCYSLLVL